LIINHKDRIKIYGNKLEEKYCIIFRRSGTNIVRNNGGSICDNVAHYVKKSIWDNDNYLYMGRVISVFTMVSSTMMPIGMIIFGPLADKISIDIILIFTGIGVTLLSVLLITSKTLIKAGGDEETVEINN